MFSSPQDHIFLTVTEKKFIASNHIYLFEFSNNNSRTKYKICSKLTTETTDMVLVLIYFNTFKLNKFEYI